MCQIEHDALALERRLLVLGPVWIAGLLARDVIDPATVRLDLLGTVGKLVSQIQPAERVADGTDLVTDVVSCIVGHGDVRYVVGEEVVEVVGHRVVLAYVYEEA